MKTFYCFFTWLFLASHSPAAYAVELVWELLPGRARDIGVGADGSVWIVGSGAEDGDVYRWSGSSWTPVGGSGVLIAVGPQGDPWLVNSNSDLFHRVNNQWVLITASGSVTGVGVGPDGTVLVTGGSFNPGIYYDKPLYRYTSTSGFSPIWGVGVVIEPDGNGWWLLDGGGHISRWFGGPGYVSIEGHAKDISRGARGDVWIVGSDGRIFRWNGNQFDPATTGLASKISVGPDGTPWLVGSGKVFHGHLLALSAGDSTVTEGTALQFPVTLSYPSDRPASVAYQIFRPDNTLASSGAVQFSAGQTNQVISLATANDTVFTGPLVYRLQLTNAVGADLQRATAMGKVVDDEVESPLLTPFLSGGGGFAVRCTSQRGFTYQLQRRESFGGDSTWTPLVVLAGTGAMLEFGDASRPIARGFYRIVVFPAIP